MGIFDSNTPTSTPGTPQGAFAQLGELLKKLAPMFSRGQSGQPQGGGGTPAQIGRVFDPSNPQSSPTPVFSTPQASAVAPNPQAPSPLLAQLGTWQPNKRASSGATALSAIDSVAQAITGFKQKRDSDNITKAQNSLNMFINAMNKGDMQVANLLASDPKVVKSWEKYLKMEFPRVPGGEGGKPGQQAPLGQLNQPGGIAATRDTTAELMQSLGVQKEQQGIATSKAQENEATAQATAIPLTTKADVDRASAAVSASNAEAALNTQRAEVEKAQAGDVKALNDAQIQLLNNQAAADLARSRYYDTLAGAGGFTPQQLASLYTRDMRGLQDMRKTASANVVALQKKMESKTTDLLVKGLSKVGITSSYEDDLKKALAVQDSLDNGIATLGKLQDDVVRGKISHSDALQKAYDAAGMDTVVPADDAPPTELLEDGQVKSFSNGQDWTLQNGKPVRVK